MSLKCGIVGLPNVGKSTLFNALANNKAEAANFPFCTIEPNVGVINVPDMRLQVLADLINPKQVLPTTFEFVDIAGLVKGASKGEGLGNQFLGHIREVDAIAHVVRCFSDDNIVHVDGRVDPVADKDIINMELQLKDLDTIGKRVSKVERQMKSGDPKAKKELAILNTFMEALHAGKGAFTVELDKEDAWVREALQLITDKPVIYVANVDEASLKSGNAYVEALRESVKEEQAEVIVVCAALEAQIAELEELEERKEFLMEYGLQDSGLNRLIKTAYDTLDLITFFTAGEKEVRAWTVMDGWKAPQAAGVIHSDFERGFIRAEVIKLPDYQQYGSESACRDAGKLAIEGKEYVVRDGDIMHFRFNV